MGSKRTITHLTELLWRCARLPEIGEAGVDNWVFENGDFARHHMRRLEADAVFERWVYGTRGTPGCANCNSIQVEDGWGRRLNGHPCVPSGRRDWLLVYHTLNSLQGDKYTRNVSSHSLLKGIDVNDVCIHMG